MNGRTEVRRDMIKRRQREENKITVEKEKENGR